MDEKWLVQYESAIEHIWHAAASTEQENDAKIKNEWKKKLKKQNVLDYARAHGLIKEEQPNKKAKLNKEMIIKYAKKDSGMIRHGNITPTVDPIALFNVMDVVKKI